MTFFVFVFDTGFTMLLRLASSIPIASASQVAGTTGACPVSTLKSLLLTYSSATVK